MFICDMDCARREMLARIRSFHGFRSAANQNVMKLGNAWKLYVIFHTYFGPIITKLVRQFIYAQDKIYWMRNR